MTAIVEKLLQYGAAVDALDSLERTPLFVAANRRHHDIAKLLIHHHANVNAEELYGTNLQCIECLMLFRVLAFSSPQVEGAAQ